MEPFNNVSNKVIDNFIKWLPKKMIKNFETMKINLRKVCKENFTYIINEDVDLADEQVKLYNYYYYITTTLYREVFHATTCPDSKHQNILGPDFNAIHSQASFEIIETTKNQILEECQEWRDREHPLVLMFPYFDHLSKRRKMKAVENDFKYLVIHFLNIYFSGSKELLINKSTSYIMNKAMLGAGAKHGDTFTDHYQGSTSKLFEVGSFDGLNNNDLMPLGNDKNDFYYLKVKLFDEIDSRIARSLNELSFESIIKNGTGRVKLSDLCYHVYGNRYTLNKKNIADRVVFFNKYGIIRCYNNRSDIDEFESLAFYTNLKLEITEEGPYISFRINEVVREFMRDRLLQDINDV